MPCRPVVADGSASASGTADQFIDVDANTLDASKSATVTFTGVTNGQLHGTVTMPGGAVAFVCAALEYGGQVALVFVGPQLAGPNTIGTVLLGSH